MSLIHWKWCALKMAWHNSSHYHRIYLWKWKAPKSSPWMFRCLTEVVRYSGTEIRDFAIVLSRCLFNTCWWLHGRIGLVLAGAYRVYFGNLWICFKALRSIRVFWEVTLCQRVKRSRRFDKPHCVFLTAKHCCVFRQTFLQVSNL